MRKFLVLLLPLLLISFARADPPFAGELSVIGRCDSCCIETYPITFTITMDNTNSNFEYTIKEYWIKTEGETTLERIRNQNITLGSNDILNLYINTQIPTVLNETFGYKVCVEYVYTDDYYIQRETEKCSVLEKKSAFPLSKYFGKEICCSNAGCDINERCLSNYSCQLLSCGECQYISNHNCIPYQCCADYDCNETSTCRNNVCAPITCSGEIVNRTCITWLGLPAFSLPGWMRDVFGESFSSFLENNMVLLAFGIVFIIVFIVVIVWLLRSGQEEKPKGIVPRLTLGGREIGKPRKKPKKEEKGIKKKEIEKKGKKGEKKEKEPEKEGEKPGSEGPEYVPLVELPE